MAWLSATRFVGARRIVGKQRIFEQMVEIERLAKACEDVLAGGGDIDVAVAGRKHAGRDAGRMVVAGLARHVLGDQPARRLEIQQRDLRAEQRRLHPLALAGNFAFQQRDQNSHRAEDAGAEIGDGDADAHRALARQDR